MHKKYQLILDIQRGSMSLVWTPACSILLNLMVMGKGSFTMYSQHKESSSRKKHQRHTNNISAEKGIDPAHDQCIGDNHGHVVLHHAHHALHSIWIRQRVRRRLALLLRVLQIGAGFETINQKVSTSLKGLARQNVVVVPQVGAVGEGTLLANGLDVGLLRGGCHEYGRIVAEDARQDHDNGDGDQDPVAVRSLTLAMPAGATSRGHVQELGVPVQGLSWDLRHDGGLLG